MKYLKKILLSLGVLWSCLPLGAEITGNMIRTADGNCWLQDLRRDGVPLRPHEHVFHIVELVHRDVDGWRHTVVLPLRNVNVYDDQVLLGQMAHFIPGRVIVRLLDGVPIPPPNFERRADEHFGLSVWGFSGAPAY